MKTKTNARVLSWILSICMIAALIPAIPATTAEAADATYVYDFSAVGNAVLSAYNTANSTSETFLHFYGTTSGSTGNVLSGETVDAWSTYAMAESAGSDPWELTLVRAYSGSGAGYFNNFGFYAPVRTSSRGTTIRVNFKVPVSGYYNLTTDLNSSSGTNASMTFILCENSDSITATEDISGTVEKLINDSFTFATTGNYLDQSLNSGKPVYLDSSKEYVANYKTVNTDKNGNFYIKNLKLTAHTPEITSSATIPTTMSIGSSVTTEFGVSIDENATINEVSSNNSDVSVVPNGDGTYTINAVREGFATITVASGDISKQYNIAVRNAPTGTTYYYSGMSNKSYATVLNSAADATVYNAARADITYALTSANNSSPWKFFTHLIQSGYTGNNSMIIAPDALKLNSVNANVVAYIDVKVPAAGWYYLDTDYDYGTDGKAAFTVYAHDASGGGLSSRLARRDAPLSEVFDISKPIYLTNAYDMCFLYSLEEEAVEKYANIYSTTITPVTNDSEVALEPLSTVPASFNVGDAAQTVSFEIGAVVPESIEATVVGDAVTAETTTTMYNATIVKSQNVTFTPVKEGTATVTVSATYAGKTVTKDYTITVTKPAVEITNAEIFGDVSAYITNDRKFTALAGIDCTNYKEVGFYIAYNGNNLFEKCAVSDGKVYKNIKIDWVSSSRDISYTDFFPTTTAKGNDPYIFFSSMTFSSALPSSVEFYPYAVDMNGNEIKGHTYSVTLS